MDEFPCDHYPGWIPDYERYSLNHPIYYWGCTRCGTRITASKEVMPGPPPNCDHLLREGVATISCRWDER